MAAMKKIGVGFAALAGMALVGVIVENHSKKWYIKGVETAEISRIRTLISDVLQAVYGVCKSIERIRM